MGVRIAVDVEIAVGERVDAGVTVWVGGTVGDESGEAELVRAQAERMRVTIHKAPIIFILFIGLIFEAYKKYITRTTMTRNEHNPDQVCVRA